MPIQTAVNAHNSLDTKALLDNAPEDVEGDDELRFRLRQENADKTQENVELATKRREKLEAEGGFRTLLQGVNRRTGLPNWSSDVKQVDKVYGGRGLRHWREPPRHTEGLARTRGVKWNCRGV